jgi:hypothetical protein
MTPLHRVALDDIAPTPWRNGGGRTRELLTWPTAGAWRLRVSVAEIECDGAFSAFPGVQRWFAVLRGAGVRLHLPGGVATVRDGGAPLAFDGRAAPHCELIDGPTQDLNFMLQGGSTLGSLGRSNPGGRLDGALRWRGVFVLGSARLDMDGQVHRLDPGTLAWSDDPAPARWTLPAGGPAWWLTLLP